MYLTSWMAMIFPLVPQPPSPVASIAQDLIRQCCKDRRLIRNPTQPKEQCEDSPALACTATPHGPPQGWHYQPGICPLRQCRSTFGCEAATRFHGLQRTLSAGRMDGILSLNTLRAPAVRACFPRMKHNFTPVGL